MQNSDLFVHYALSFVGIPYLWGGTNPHLGLDCSALVRILLHNQGLISENHGGNAEAIYKLFSQDGGGTKGLIKLGSLIFYSNGTGVVDHVAMALNSQQHIEAAGGDSTTTSLAVAYAQNAFVRVTPIRSNYLTAILPHYSFFTE